MATSRTCLVFIFIQLIYLISAQEVVKRVPHGFVGMRGKKYIDSGEMEQLIKRKPQFFVGVKGKKNMLDSMDNDQLYLKRVPMGFVGMRGKKEYLLPGGAPYPETYGYAPNTAGSLVGKIDYSTNEDFKTSNEVDYPMLNELSKYLEQIENPNLIESDMNPNLPVNEVDQSNERITNEIEKRAANMHQFFGVRGKKSILNKRPYDLTFRGKFIGVRGKKDLKNVSAQEIKFLLDQSGPWPKRKAQMGFFGMRGKKWADETSANMESIN